MPSHKALKSISHNFSHSFISLMNYWDNDYFMGHLLTQARKANLCKLEVDVLKNIIKPEGLITDIIKKAIHCWNNLFPDLVRRSGSSMDYIKSANLIIEFNLKFTRPRIINNKQYIENPYTCKFIIIDEKGKVYKSKHEGWWFPES